MKYIRKMTMAALVAFSVVACNYTKSDEPNNGMDAENVVAALEEACPENDGGGGGLNDHAYVDLGLTSGTLWATCNVGASKPEGYGYYYAWGETETKGAYNWETYKYANGKYDKLTKYCNKSVFGNFGNNGFTDNLTTLQASDDPAASWGNGWHTPSKTQWDELLANTTWEWTTYNGVKGRFFTSRRNGKRLFLPAAGRGGGNSYPRPTGFYWSRSLYVDNPYRAWHFAFDSGYDARTYNSYDRSYGFSVRPVREN